VRHGETAVAAMGKLGEASACGEDLCQANKVRVIGDACA